MCDKIPQTGHPLEMLGITARFLAPNRVIMTLDSIVQSHQPELQERKSSVIKRNTSLESTTVRPSARRSAAAADAASYVAPELRQAGTREPASPPRPIFLMAEELVQIWSSNERIFAVLRGLRMKRIRARAYLASPGCNRLLGHAYLERLETSRRQHIEQLRANRHAAWTLVSKFGSEFAPQSDLHCLGTSGSANQSCAANSQRHCTNCCSA